MEISLLGKERLDKYLASLATKEPGELMTIYLQMRTAKAAVNKHAEAAEAEFKEVMQAIENRLLQKADAASVTGFKFKGIGTSYTATETKVSIADDNAFYDFVAAQGRDGLEFFERRVVMKAVDAWMENNGGVTPPGLNLFRNRTMRVRKDSEK